MQSDLPLIVDADGLNILAENVDKDFQPNHPLFFYAGLNAFSFFYSSNRSVSTVH